MVVLPTLAPELAGGATVALAGDVFPPKSQSYGAVSQVSLIRDDR